MIGPPSDDEKKERKDFAFRIMLPRASSKEVVDPGAIQLKVDREKRPDG